MNTEQAKQLSETALDRLMEALDRGQSEALRLYLAVMAKFHRYSWGNVLLIYMQRPDATHVAGFHSWLRMRRYVRKGEKGIVILAPMVGRKRSDEAELSEDRQTRVFGYRAAHVFDVSQTDGDPLPEFTRVHGDPAGSTERLKSFVRIPRDRTRIRRPDPACTRFVRRRQNPVVARDGRRRGVLGSRP